MSRSYLITALERLAREEDGPTAVEYAVMLSLIIGVCIGAVRALSDAAAGSFNASSDAIDAAMNGP